MSKKLNDLDLESYNLTYNAITFVFPNATLTQIDELDMSNLVVTDNGVEVAMFKSFSVGNVEVNQATGEVILTAVRKLDDTTAEAINELDHNVALLNTKMNKTESVANDAHEIASNSGVTPAIKSAVSLYVMTATNIPSTDVANVSDLIPDWKPDISYKQGQLVKYDNKVYRLAQNTTSSDIFKPGEGTESIYTLIDIAEDGVRIWHMPTDATNSFALNELAHYPTASDPIYRSKRNGNTSEPTKDEWWELDE